MHHGPCRASSCLIVAFYSMVSPVQDTADCCLHSIHISPIASPSPSWALHTLCVFWLVASSPCAFLSHGLSQGLHLCRYITTSMAYVNVHTVQYPDGIIRSNISPANMIKSA